MKLALVSFMTILMSWWTLSQGLSNLKPGFGVNYKAVGEVQTVIYRKYLTIHLDLPKYDSILESMKQLVDCKPDRFTFSNAQSKVKAYRPAMEICYKINTVMGNLKSLVQEHEEAINTQIASINDILKHNSRANTVGEYRNKRGIGAIFSVITGIAGFFSNLAQRKQISSIRNTVNYLMENDFKVNNRVNEIAEDLALVANGTARDFKKLNRYVSETANRLDQVTVNVSKHLDIIYGWLPLIQDNVQLINQISETIVYAHNVTTTLAEIAHSLIMHFEEQRDYLRIYETSLIDLLNGKLPSTLIKPQLFSKIIKDLKKEIIYTDPGYNVLFNRVNQYFRKTDIVYTVVEDKIVLSIPVYLVRANQKPMTLYQIEQCFIPYKSKDGKQEGSYTRVQFDHEYLAVDGKNYMVLSMSQLGHCNRIDDLYLCEDPLIQLSQQSLTCSSAIFYDHDAETVNKHCDFKYIHKTEPIPCILEADDSVLLANIGSDWSFKCKSSDAAKIIEGSNYAVINRESLCHCALDGKKFFIPERLNYCNNKEYPVQVSFPINAIAATVFHHRILAPGLLSDLSKLFSTPKSLNLPKIEFELPETDLGTALSQDYSKELDMHRVAKLISAKEPIYWDMQDNISNWYKTLDKIALVISFILSVLGTIALVLGLYNCIRNYRITTLFGLMVNQIKLTDAAGQYTESDIISSIWDKIVQMLILLTFWIIYKLVKYIIFRWSMIRLLTPTIVASDTRPTSHLILEIFSPKIGKSRVYLASAQVSIADLTWNEEPRIDHIKIEITRRKIFNDLKIDWKKMDILQCKSIPMDLPRVAPLPWHMTNKVRETLAAAHNLRILVTCEGLTYCTYYQRNTMEKLEDVNMDVKPKRIRNKPRRVCIASYHSNMEILELKELKEQEPDSISLEEELAHPSLTREAMICGQ